MALALRNPNMRILEDTVFDPGGIEARRLLSPGNTCANMSAFIPRDEVVITGDFAVADYVPYTEDPTSRSFSLEFS
jgi:glyoxylase-like metal-dependent hydrolase (beta-lactamase superfamily II)